MPPATHELGRASRLNANAHGLPGQRHFRLLVEAEGGRACLWLEKEQLFNLAIAAKRLIAIASRPEPAPPPASEPPGAVGNLDLDFKASQLFLSQQSPGGLFVVAARGVQASGAEETPTVSFQATAPKLQALAEEALEVCAAGRPRCPLCGAPMDPAPHVCIRSNGHFAGQRGDRPS